jgi:hypothetical protein
MRLSLADHKRIIYWFHLAFRRKEPSNGDKRTMIMIQNIARIISDEKDDVDEWYGDDFSDHF